MNDDGVFKRLVEDVTYLRHLARGKVMSLKQPKLVCRRVKHVLENNLLKGKASWAEIGIHIA